MQRVQQGFTLLELLVVITLLAILSAGALVAYEGIGENASDAAAANNIKAADSAIRSFRAVTGAYPNQWDNLANLAGETAGGAYDVLSDATKEFFGQWEVDSTNPVALAIMRSLAEVGVTELQTLQATSVRADLSVAPNEFFNESAPNVTNPADELEWEFEGGALDELVYGADAVTEFNVAVVPSSNGTTCSAGGNVLNVSLAQAAEGTPVPVTNSSALNRINDHLENDLCHVVIAVGFGKDVPGTTLNSPVAISTAPTYTNGNVINPSQHYARYIALFHVASDSDEGAASDGVIALDEVLPKARLLAVVDTEGRNIDQAIAGAFASN